MATDYKLTWRDEQGGRWQKRYKGKLYYFRRIQGEAKEASYRRCYAEWQKKKEQIDSAATAVEPWRQAILNMIASTIAERDVVQREDTPDNRDRWLELTETLRAYERDLAKGKNPFLDTDEQGNPTDYWGEAVVTGDDSDDDLPPWEIASYDIAPGIPGPSNPEFYLPTPKAAETLGVNIKAFLTEKEKEADNGELSKGRVEVLRVGLAAFEAHAGTTLPVKKIDEGILISFRDVAKDARHHKTEKKLTAHSIRDRLQAVKQFVRWAWRRKLIENWPRVLENRAQDLTIKLPDANIDIFTDNEVAKLLTGSAEKTTLYLLLCLNCAMTQRDISDLLKTEVDWKAGRIKRKRSKTRDAGDNVPVVSYLLWPETFRLLKKYGSDHETLALTNDNGEPLLVEKLVNGKAKKNDNVRSAYSRLASKLKIDKPLKLLRKTAATKLGTHATHSRFAQYFLGHAPNSVADKHYVAPSAKQFDAAVKWLGVQFLSR